MTRPHNDRVARIGSDEEIEPMTWGEYIFVGIAIIVISLVVVGAVDTLIGLIEMV